MPRVLLPLVVGIRPSSSFSGFLWGFLLPPLFCRCGSDGGGGVWNLDYGWNVGVVGIIISYR